MSEEAQQNDEKLIDQDAGDVRLDDERPEDTLVPIFIRGSIYKMVHWGITRAKMKAQLKKREKKRAAIPWKEAVFITPQGTERALDYKIYDGRVWFSSWGERRSRSIRPTTRTTRSRHGPSTGKPGKRRHRSRLRALKNTRTKKAYWLMTDYGLSAM